MIPLLHPEAICDDCHNFNTVWYADNDLWNKVMPDDGGILCPQCFANRAYKKGLVVNFHCSETETAHSERKV